MPWIPLNYERKFLYNRTLRFKLAPTADQNWTFLICAEDYFTLVMVEKDGCNSCLTALRVLRVSLVDELEGRIDSLLEILVSREVFTRDDREEVLCHLGPRARVRKVLDILECKGEEAAETFLSISSHQQEAQTRSKEGNTDQPQSVGMPLKPQRCYWYI